MNTTSHKDILVNFEKKPRICSILYDGRSGSVFLQSLLDNHPDVSTFPATAMCGGRRGVHINKILDQVESLNWENLGQLFVDQYPVVFDSSDDTTNCRLHQLGADQNETLNIKKEDFLRSWQSMDPLEKKSRRTFFIAIHMAYELAKGRSLGANFTIVHAMHTPEPSMEPLCSAFPEMRILLMTREPLETFNSHFRHHIKAYEVENPGKNFWDLEESAEYPFHIFKNIFTSYENIGKWARNRNFVRAIRLEDLHEQIEPTMQKLCNWLDIKYSNECKQATFGGKTHWGDISIELKTGAWRPKGLFDWKKHYFKNDAEVLVTLLRERYEIYQYPYERTLVKKTSSEFDQSAGLPNKWECEYLAHIYGTTSSKAQTLFKTKANFACSVLEKVFKSKKTELLTRIRKQITSRIEFSKSMLHRQEIQIPYL